MVRPWRAHGVVAGAANPNRPATASRDSTDRAKCLACWRNFIARIRRRPSCSRKKRTVIKRAASIASSLSIARPTCRATHRSSRTAGAKSSLTAIRNTARHTTMRPSASPRGNVGNAPATRHGSAASFAGRASIISASPHRTATAPSGRRAALTSVSSISPVSRKTVITCTRASGPISLRSMSFHTGTGPASKATRFRSWCTQTRPKSNCSSMTNPSGARSSAWIR